MVCRMAASTNGCRPKRPVMRAAARCTLAVIRRYPYRRLEFLHSLQPEGRKIIAHGASRGNSVLGNRAPERGERLVSTPQVAHIVCHAVLP